MVQSDIELNGNPIELPAAKSAAASTNNYAAQLHNIQVLVAVAQAESIAGAAKQLFKAPSAVSRSILQLEAAMGLPLFDREPRGMRLNELGELVYVRACRIQSEIHFAADELVRSRGAGAGSRSSIASYLFSEKKLQLVVALATTRSFKRAAEQLGLKPAGASMALARMQEVIGQPLFEKKAQGIVATDAAVNLIVRGKRVFAELRHLSSDVSAFNGELRGTVVIGTLPVGRSYLVPSTVAALLSRYPGLQLTSVESPGVHLIQGLRTGEIDIFVGILRDSARRHEIASEWLFNDDLCILVRSGHPLAVRREIALSELVTWQWILPDRSTLARKMTENVFRNQGLDPPAPSLESSDSALIREVLRTSGMLAVAGRNQMTFEIKSGVLHELPLRLPGTVRKIALLTREGAMLSSAAKMVVDALRFAAQGL
ncbi:MULTISPECIES: LysR family transcriptional regulator [unclassified Sinorhizobium]|uniref:LysR family transcriptional regulator n=1 Tax=unclassified Sinorhizobium TaxID=2613772 RepID=UPI0035252D0B